MTFLFPKEDFWTTYTCLLSPMCEGETMRTAVIIGLLVLAFVVLGCTSQSAVPQESQQDSESAQAAGQAPKGVTNPQKNYVEFKQDVPGTVVGMLPTRYGYFVSVAESGNVQNPKVYRDVVSTQSYYLGQPVAVKLDVHNNVVGLSA